MIDSWEDQMGRARTLGAAEGTQGLWRHAMVGRICGCRDCFCCAATVVRDEMSEDIRRARLAAQRAGMDLHRYERAGMPAEAAAVRRAIENTLARVRRLEKGGGTP